MSLNTLETAYVNGQIVDASHVNELTLSLLGQFVGRDPNGVPTPSQSLGTLAIPWGNIYAEGLILGGSAVDTSQIVSAPNRIVSGKERALSSQPDFLRANGAALEFSILGATTDLVLSVNNAATSVTSDLVKTGIVAAPSTNNTALVNDSSIVSDLYAGEIDYSINKITIGTVGTEISNRIGQLAAFKTPTGEIFRGLIKSATEIVNVFRGFYFDSSGTPIVRASLSDTNTLTLMNLGFVFVEDNGVTVDVTYRTPVVSYTAPNSPQTGDYWFDISNQVWKRYSGASFEIINRILIGEIVSDSTNTIATRAYDFSNSFDEFNNVEIEVSSTEIVKASDLSTRCNVYGSKIEVDLTQLEWNITTDLESGLIEASDTTYYLYLSDEGRRIISDKRPYKRPDLRGFYHPWDSYRCVGVAYNDASNDFKVCSEIPFNSVIKSKVASFSYTVGSGVQGGTATSGSWQIRPVNTTEQSQNFMLLQSNQLFNCLGTYKVEAFGHFYLVDGCKLRFENIEASLTSLEGHTIRSNNSTIGLTAPLEGVFNTKISGRHELQYRVGTTRATDGLGVGDGVAGNEVYVTIKIEKIG